MSWWGKLLGGAFGYVLGGPIGALLGAVLGHNFDKGFGRRDPGIETVGPAERERVQTVFFTATFSVMGHIAKADGRVSEQEIAVAEAVMEQMDLSPELRRMAMRLFDEGKSPRFNLDEVLDQFRAEAHRRQSLIQMFVEIQLQAAYADAHLDPVEERLLLHICDRLGVSRALFRGLEQLVRLQYRFTEEGSRAGGRRAEAPARPSLADAYAVLGVGSDASDEDVTRAYRRLLSRHHPDKLVAKGLPDEMMKLATQKTHEIRKAYEMIRGARGLPV